MVWVFRRGRDLHESKAASMRRVVALGIAAFLSSPASAQDVMTPEEFQSLAEGRTLYFTYDGAPYGQEQYFPGRRSLWRYEDGSCGRGVWWGDGEAICFRYEREPVPQCWRFVERPGGVAAELVEGGVRTGFVVEMSHADGKPLTCPAPYVGS
jgi:hypothetical protein